jgi:hypothetical protein
MAKRLADGAAMTIGTEMQGELSAVRFVAIIDDKFEFADIFPSTFWTHHANTLIVNDIIRVRRRDGAWDVEIAVTGKAENGAVRVDPWPIYPAETVAEQASAQPTGIVDLQLQMVPIHTDGEPRARTQYLPATKWRVMGWDGQEVSRDHETEAKARESLMKYLADLRMRMPTAEELAAARAEIESKKKGRAS